METNNLSAIEAARQRLAYWQKQRELAARNADAKRLAQCDNFIAQCEVVLRALKHT
jgi:hypothetical protein